MEIGRVFFSLLFFFSYNPPPIFFCPRAKCTGRKLRERDGKLKTLFASKLSQFGEKGGGKGARKKKRVKKTLLPSSIFFPGRSEMEVGVVVRVRPPKETKPSRKSCTPSALSHSLTLSSTSQYEGWTSKERGRQKNSPFLSDGLSGRRGYLTLFFPFALRLGGKRRGRRWRCDPLPSPPPIQSVSLRGSQGPSRRRRRTRGGGGERNPMGRDF